MQSIVRRFNTQDNTYFVGYGMIAKTSYEQQEERKAERNYMIVQRLFGLALIALCIILIIAFPDKELRGCMVFVGLPLGLLITLTKQHAICL
jgi:cell division protein FtsW (lipid II flippase)